MSRDAASDGDAPLASLIRPFPRDPRVGPAQERIADLRADVPSSSKLQPFLAERGPSSLLHAIAAGSSFLWTLVRTDPERCATLLEHNPHVRLAEILAALAQQVGDPALDGAGLMQALRLARQEVALLVALADLGGVWSLDEVTEALTRFADAAVASAVGFLVREAVRSGRLKPETTAASCGLAVLALGKAGGRELNYSSDIDLVVLFDPRAAALAEGTAAAPFYVKATQTMARLLGDRTGDGFVLRVDLRLRPDPASTAVAIAVPAALHYYENLGQNWERAAFIKARPIAGDLALGREVLREIAPFIWRKYFDYAAIADIHAMKRQINAARGGGMAVPGFDVKLGRGGIREIEFFVQTQQLIFGGRRTALRGSQTCAMLAALAEEGWVDAAARDELTAAYVFLRTVEHRLQMVADQQTQKVPDEPSQLENFARFSGFDDAAAFSATLVAHLATVQRHYRRLFEHAPSLGTAEGSLVFTGTEPDPGTVATLRTMGFRRPDLAAELVRGWHFGRRPAVQSPRAREVLTELVPALLEAFAQSGDPDGGLAAFDTVLSRIKSAVELLSLLRSHAAVRDLFADVLGSAPSLADTVSRRPHVLDAAIDPSLLDRSGRGAPSRIAAVLAQAASMEDFLDRMRDVAAEELFLVGLRTLSLSADMAAVERERSDIADAIVRAALTRCHDDFAGQHGRLAGSGCVVLGMGKLGSRELTATSDLDLIVIYRSDPGCPESDGARPLDPARYYARLTQRLIAGLTAPTRRGRLYDVDVRLRPSGRQGPLAIQYSAFLGYQDGEAQTWEHMALTRARVVAGDPDLARDVDEQIARLLRRVRDPQRLRHDVAAMRALVAREKADGDFWDMKLPPGGLLDIEFAAQYLQLAHAHAHPTLCLRHPRAVLEEAARLGLQPSSQAAAMMEAHRLQSTIQQLLRLMMDAPVSPERLGEGGLRRICEAAKQPSLSHLRSELAALRTTVRTALQAMLHTRLPDPAEPSKPQTQTLTAGRPAAKPSSPATPTKGS